MFRVRNAFAGGSFRRGAIPDVLYVVALIALAGAQLFAAKSPSRGSPRFAQANAGSAEGKKLFESQCAACHGLDGHGGERAPDIATNSKTQNRSDDELQRVVQRGIPGTGMPAFPAFGDDERQHIVAHLRQLQGKTTGQVKLPGDPRKGRETFFGKGRCSECHTVGGSGGFIGQDLTTLGSARSAEKIREAILKPENGGSRYSIVTREGQTFSGVLRNQDNFSIQIQALDGTFHSFEKTNVQRFTREPGSIMPSDYGSKLSPTELDDLISFLLAAGRDAKSLMPADKRTHDEGADDDE